MLLVIIALLNWNYIYLYELTRDRLSAGCNIRIIFLQHFGTTFA